MHRWVDDYMAFFEFQGRKKDKEIKPYVYLARSYRDEDGVVQKDRIYLGKDEDKRKFSYKEECKECGTKSDTLFLDLCADCLSERDKEEIEDLKESVI